MSRLACHDAASALVVSDSTVTAETEVGRGISSVEAYLAIVELTGRAGEAQGRRYGQLATTIGRVLSQCA